MEKVTIDGKHRPEGMEVGIYRIRCKHFDFLSDKPNTLIFCSKCHKWLNGVRIGCIEIKLDNGVLKAESKK